MQEERNKIIKEYKEQGREKEISTTLLQINQKCQGKTKLPKDFSNHLPLFFNSL